MRAVIFDLFCTLVPGGTDAERADAARAMGKALGLDAEAFANRYHECWPQRFRGELGDLRQTVRTIAAQVDPAAVPAAAAVEQAVRLRLDLLRTWLTPTPHALSTLELLRARGWRLGLLSNCSKETEEVFGETPLAGGYFDAVGLSCALGVAKPHADAYRLVATLLGVPTTDCVFVGDGAGGELPGAAAVGARPIQVTELAAEDDPAPPWAGERVHSVADVPALIGVPDGDVRADL